MPIYYNIKKNINTLNNIRGISILTVIFYSFFFIIFREKEIEDNILLIFYSLSNNYLNLSVFSISLLYLFIGLIISISSKREDLSTLIYNFFIKKSFKLFLRYCFLTILIGYIHVKKYHK